MNRFAFQLSILFACLGIILAAPTVKAVSPLIVQQAGGEIGDAVVVGDVAYLAQGASISVWTLANDASFPPTQIAITPPLAGFVKGVAVSGSHLFASWRDSSFNGGLAVFSLADPLQPAYLFDFAYNASTYRGPAGMVVVGNTLLLTDSEAGVFSIDISDPTSPSVNGFTFSFGLQRLAVSGSLLVGWGSGFSGFSVELIDITDPTTPATLGYYSSFGNFLDGAVDGDLLVLVGDGFETISLADPTNPTLITTVPGSGTFVRSLVLRDGLAYMGDANGVQVWDMSDPAAPVTGTLVPAPADRTERAALHTIAGGTEALMFTGSGVGFTLDLSAPAVPTLSHSFDLPVGTDSEEVVGFGTNVAVADFYSGLRVVDENLNSVGRYEPGIANGGYEDLEVQGSTAYLTAWGYGLLTIDLATPATPVGLGDFSLPQASAVSVSGGLAYLVNSSVTATFQIVDVGDPSVPSARGSLPMNRALDVVYADNMAVVAGAAGNGLRVFDVLNPDAPALIGTYSACSSAGGVAVDHGLAFLACHDGSMHVVSLADPTNPLQLGVFTDPVNFLEGSRVAVEGNVAWFGHSLGLDLIDVSDPTMPTWLQRVELPITVRGISLDANGNGWVAAGSAGVYRVEPTIFRDGFESGGLDDLSADTP